MKIIEAMKRVKQNKEKIVDLQKKVADHAAHLSIETPMYGQNTAQQVAGWQQACHDLTLDNVGLLVAIARTNLATMVTIKLGDQSVTKCVAEWVWRRREYAAIDAKTWAVLGDRGLKEGTVPNSVPGSEPVRVTIVRNYDPRIRDDKLAMFKSEPHEIDAALEVVNATTDLIEE